MHSTNLLMHTTLHYTTFVLTIKLICTNETKRKEPKQVGPANATPVMGSVACCCWYREIWPAQRLFSVTKIRQLNNNSFLTSTKQFYLSVQARGEHRHPQVESSLGCFGEFGMNSLEHNERNCATGDVQGISCPTGIVELLIELKGATFLLGMVLR